MAIPRLKIAVKQETNTPVRTNEVLRRIAQRVYPDNLILRKKWIAAAKFLNTSKKGWAIDKIAKEEPEQRVL